MSAAISLLVDAPDARSAESVGATISRYPAHLVAKMRDADTRVVVLSKREKYRDRSPELRRLNAGIDEWPVSPAGLFVVDERTLYLRSTSPMAVAHEAGHALDCALGDGVYYSGQTPAIRLAFTAARGFVTPYAASGLDEYFAEACRAMVEVNDAASPWPRVSREAACAGRPDAVRVAPHDLARGAGRADDPGRCRVRRFGGADASVIVVVLGGLAILVAYMAAAFWWIAR